MEAGTVMPEERELDCRGLSCPQPVLETKKALDWMETGCLRVMVDNEAARTNVTNFALAQGCEVESEGLGGDFLLRIRKLGSPATPPPTPFACPSPGAKGTVILISSEVLGRGDDVLGKTLMAAYLDTLSQFAKEISHVILMNSGVKLAAEGSLVLDQLRGLEKVGAQVLSCGTCLNHYGLRERLQVGGVSNMLSILETLFSAGRVLSP